MVNVEELHVWGVSSSRTAVTAHLLVNSGGTGAELPASDDLLALAAERLAGLGIRRSTLQLEGRFRLT